MDKSIQMVDLNGQYLRIKDEMDQAIQEIINETSFINGPVVSKFSKALSEYLQVQHVIPCANGTDALQVALMSLGLEIGDEIIVPCFTYVATVEVIALLKLKPVLIEVDSETFNIEADKIEELITSRTKAIVPVHLYGQCADMEKILDIAKKYSLYVIEDAAQALGAEYTFSDGTTKKAGTMGDIGCTSFFPSKNLGCYGDGGAIFTNNDDIGRSLKKIVNHGQSKKYHHEIIGVNSRLDSLQAAVLKVKLPYLDSYAKARNDAADFYDEQLGNLKWLTIPKRSEVSTHVFHQYTIKLIDANDRDKLKAHLQEQGIPSMIYYPMPVHFQEAFKTPEFQKGDFLISEDLCTRVLSLPIHTEMDINELAFITETIKLLK